MIVFITILVRCLFINIFFFKQKTAYEMRISDWSSDVCSSDLEVLMLGVSTRSLYIEPAAVTAMDARCQVISVSPLMRQLLLEAVELEIGRASCRERVCQYV